MTSETKEWIEKLDDEELKKAVQYMQDELQFRAERKLAEAWNKIKKSIEEYLRMGGAITFTYYNPETESQNDCTLAADEIIVGQEGEILLDN